MLLDLENNSHTARPVTMVSLFDDPDPDLLASLYKTYWTAKKLGDTGLHVVNVKCIHSVVMLAPNEHYEGGVEAGYWYLMEKPGLKLLGMICAFTETDRGDKDTNGVT
ncbi:hypothetical protein EV421DRAFT_1744226 [Armillaria borealis]|uniref:Uncharacterized protein n=1 Tax=Armillaria borealis TaxID=47425 RepID=A0AA39IW52_9AGAR|nr:hypothetical protein EV421DRAFT_1744226 [Armillaria borealis]